MPILHEEITGACLKAFYKVYNTLGYGFLERVYENAMMMELQKMGLKAVKQQPIKVYYEGKIVGDYFADIVVEDKVILELKAANAIIDAHHVQLRNYLKATSMEVGLLLNFGQKPESKRQIFSNDRK